MRKIILLEHLSLDGFAAGPNGEMDWIKVDSRMFELVKTITDESDTALYGRVTWQMMDAYWPEAAEKPGATNHDREHSAWYNQVEKIVISRTLQNINRPKTRFIGNPVVDEITKLKQQQGKIILFLGSPGASQVLIEQNLIDEYWLFVNPIMLGKGIPVFTTITRKIPLKLLETVEYPVGVVGLHYASAG